MMVLKQGQIIDVDVVRITSDGQGVGLTSDGIPIIIDNVDEEDLIQVEILNILEESIRGKRIPRSPGRHRKEVVKSGEDPYLEDEPLDEGEDYDEDYD